MVTPAALLVAPIASLGVPNPVLFATLTGVASLVPAIGTALVWILLAGILLGAGHMRDAVILVVLGLGVISTIDNLLRPVLARFGNRTVQPFLLFLGVVGGITAFGPWGMVLVRWCSRYSSPVTGSGRVASARARIALTSV